MSNNPPPLLPFPIAFNDTHQRLSRDTDQPITKFLNILIYSSTIPLPFETYPEGICTIPFIREHHISLLHRLSYFKTTSCFNSSKLSS